MSVAHASERFQIKAIALCEKASYLVDQSRFDHLVAPLIDQVIKFCTLAVQSDLERSQKEFHRNHVLSATRSSVCRSIHRPPVRE